MRKALPISTMLLYKLYSSNHQRHLFACVRREILRSPNKTISTNYCANIWLIFFSNRFAHIERDCTGDESNKKKYVPKIEWERKKFINHQYICLYFLFCKTQSTFIRYHCVVWIYIWISWNNKCKINYSRHISYYRWDLLTH